MYKLHIYRNADRVLAFYCEDSTEYSAIYIVTQIDNIFVASNLSDINGEVWSMGVWGKALMGLLAQPIEVELHEVEEIPAEVMMQFNRWLMGKS